MAKKNKYNYADRRPFSLWAVLSILIILASTIFAVNRIKNSRKLTAVSEAAFSAKPLYPSRNAIVYEAPRWPSSGNLLSNSEVTQRFSVAIYARNQMRANLPNYRNNNFNGDVLIYLIMDVVIGPRGLGSLNAQGKTCSELGINPNLDVSANHAAMDTGDLCEIHDAIARGTALPDYPDLRPTENWFLHKSDGSRFENSRSSNTSSYRTNPGNPVWREYYVRRVSRELANTDPNHPSVAGIDGLFIDNVELSWSKPYQENGRNPLKEYSTNTAYVTAVRGFVANTHTKLHSNGRNYPVWGNMITDPTTGTSWDSFAPYLEGGMDESFALNWGNGASSSTTIRNEMRQAENWIRGGNHFLAVSQGSTSGSLNMYAYSAYLLITDGVRASYRYSDHSGSYADYYQLSGSNWSDYNPPLGRPLSAKVQISSSPLVFERSFECGRVRLDITNHTGTINVVPNCSGSTPTPTRTPTATPRPTATPTPRPSLTPPPVPAGLDCTASDNLLANPGFESGNTSPYTFASSARGAVFEVQSSRKAEGSYAGHYYTPTDSTDSRFYQNNIPIEPRTAYRVCFLAYSTTGHDATFRITENSSPYTNLGIIQRVNLTSNWAKFEYTFNSTNSTRVDNARYRFNLELDGANDNYYFDDMVLEKANSGSCTYGPYTVPGKVEAENFTCGGEGSAYHDTTTTNQGGAYRTGEAVDIQKTGDSGDGYNIGWTRNGEWIKYRIDVSSTGLYSLVTRVASPYTSGKFRIKIDGNDVSGQKGVPNTGGWQRYRDVTVSNVNLNQGVHTLELAIEGDSANYNFIQFNLQ